MDEHELDDTRSSSSNLAPVAATQTDGVQRQRSSREGKFKAGDEQQGEKKDRKRDARSESRGCRSNEPRKDQAQPTENEPTQGELKIKTVTLKARYEDMQRRKQREPCFRCGQAGHWRRECMNAAVCQNCRQPNTTASNCTKCNSTKPTGNG